MKKFCWISLYSRLALLAAVVSCSEDDLEMAVQQPDWADISTKIIPYKDTRNQIQADGKDIFTEGDQIQMFLISENGLAPVQSTYMTLQRNEWTPQKDLKRQKMRDCRFTAYYPPLKQSYGTYGIRVAYDQRKNGYIQKAEQLCARTQEIRRGNEIRLLFKPIMSRLSVKLNSSHYTEKEISKADVEVLAATQAQIDPSTGAIIKIDYNYGLQRRIKLAYTGNGIFQAILVPQPILEEWKECTPWLTLSIGNTTKSIKAPLVLDDGTVFNELESGKEIVLNVNMEKGSGSDWTDKVHWVYGLKIPPFTSDAWGYAFVNPEDHSQKNIGLSWKAEYGWYDCNKTAPAGYSGSDTHLCWAAVSANMIHWWLDQNSAYIERYGKYRGPRKYTGSLESEIFTYYKKCYPDAGFYIINGLNWFFTHDNNLNLPGGGFFKDVFGEKPMVRVEGFFNKDECCRKHFSDAFKTAFRNRESIGCSVILPNKSAHAVTIWGAEFDAEGLVRAVFVAENDDRNRDEQCVRHIDGLDRPLIPSGIFRKAVLYYNGNIWLEGTDKEEPGQKVDHLVFLRLLEKEWESFFH